MVNITTKRLAFVALAAIDLIATAYFDFQFVSLTQFNGVAT